MLADMNWFNRTGTHLGELVTDFNKLQWILTDFNAFQLF